FGTCLLAFLFFFSSRRRHTRFSRDWSSDVCSSDLISPSQPETGYGYIEVAAESGGVFDVSRFVEKPNLATAQAYMDAGNFFWNRSEERRVGKECRSRRPQEDDKRRTP